MANIIDGKKIAEQIYSQIRLSLPNLSITPRLAIVLASNDPSSHKYVELKMKMAQKVGIETKLYHFGENINKKDLIFEIKRFRSNEAVHGVLIQVPFYSHLEEDETEIINSLIPIKDVDGLTAYQQGRVAQLIPNSILPATVEAVLECLNYCTSEDLTWDNIVKNYKTIKYLESKNILVINNSDLIGKPLSMILSTLRGTVTIANSKTKDLKNLCLNSDIIITATGKTEIISASDIKNGAVLIDVTSENKNGKILGDFVYSKELEQKASFITPVPGGVGPVTIACLLRNLVKNAGDLV